MAEICWWQKNLFQDTEDGDEIIVEGAQEEEQEDNIDEYEADSDEEYVENSDVEDEYQEEEEEEEAGPAPKIPHL